MEIGINEIYSDASCDVTMGIGVIAWGFWTKRGTRVIFSSVVKATRVSKMERLAFKSAQFHWKSTQLEKKSKSSLSVHFTDCRHNLRRSDPKILTVLLRGSRRSKKRNRDPTKIDEEHQRRQGFFDCIDHLARQKLRGCRKQWPQVELGEITSWVVPADQEKKLCPLHVLGLQHWSSFSQPFAWGSARLIAAHNKKVAFSPSST